MDVFLIFTISLQLHYAGGVGRHVQTSEDAGCSLFSCHKVTNRLPKSSSFSISLSSSLSLSYLTLWQLKTCLVVCLRLRLRGACARAHTHAKYDTHRVACPSFADVASKSVTNFTLLEFAGVWYELESTVFEVCVFLPLFSHSLSLSHAPLPSTPSPLPPGLILSRILPLPELHKLQAPLQIMGLTSTCANYGVDETRILVCAVCARVRARVHARVRACAVVQGVWCEYLFGFRASLHTRATAPDTTSQ